MLESTERAAADRKMRAQLLAEARRQYQAGAVARAWESCARVAKLSRLANDPALRDRVRLIGAVAL